MVTSKERVLTTLLMVIVSFFITTFKVAASDIPINEMYRIAADFSLAAFNMKDVIEKLEGIGWQVECVSFKLNLDQIKKEIESNPNIKFDQNFNPNPALTNESLQLLPGATFNSSDESHKSSGLYFNDLKVIYGLRSDPLIEQHFGFAVGMKRVNNKNVYVIAFRGTSDIWSWIFTDFLIWPSKFLDTATHVHTGFEWNRQACMKSETLINLVERIKKDQESCVIITGHSLGAAVAVLEAAYLIEKEGVPSGNIYLIPLAEPCPGRKDFTERYKNTVTNYTWFANKLDPVPVLTTIIGYNHFGQKIYFDNPPSSGAWNVFNWHNVYLYHEYIYSMK